MFRVCDVDELLGKGAESITPAEGDETVLLLEAGLNGMESDGWTFVRTLDQYRQGPDGTEPEGVPVGPFFIFHKEENGAARLLN
jgi:hypothetical protein